jgi:translation initiation factor 3 subunit H
MAAIIQSDQPIHAVHIDGLAVLKIVKHCQESLPNFVSGSLLGLEVKNNGILEITHSFPFPEPRDNSQSDLVKSANESSPIDDEATALDGHEYQLEMMKMLREVNVDNNCVGWYQSMYLGSYSTASLLENQLSYQTDLSPNAVVLLYDPMQTAHGNLELKCLRLTSNAVQLLKSGKNSFLDPALIFEEIPIVMKNPSLVKALLHNVSTGQYYADVNGNGNGSGEVAPAYTADTTLDRLDLSTNPYLEKHLEFLSTWVDDLSAEQGKFQYYMKSLSRGEKGRFDKRKKEEKQVSAGDAWESSEAPRRLESLLISNQIRNYCDQVDKFADGGFGKLFIMDGLQKKG